MKRCKKCNKDKGLSEFYTNSSKLNKDGGKRYDLLLKAAASYLEKMSE